jgi:micrococcal nuclease
VQCYGPEASAFTKRHLEGRRVTLERDVEQRARYGRFLAYVTVDGRRFNDELIETKRDGVGLWGMCVRSPP